MASVRGYALREVKTPPVDGPETVQKARDRLHAMIACGEENLQIEAYVVLDGERILLAEYAVRSLHLKAERLQRRIRSSSTVGELKAALRAMTPEQLALPIKIVVPTAKGTRDREMFAHAYPSRTHGPLSISGIPQGKAAKHTRNGYHDIRSAKNMLDYVEDMNKTHHRYPWPMDENPTPRPMPEEDRILLCINTAQTTDSVVGFHVSRIEIREDAVVLRYLPDGLRAV